MREGVRVVRVKLDARDIVSSSEAYLHEHGGGQQSSGLLRQYRPSQLH
jgi:hypothetical protein